MAKLRIKLKLNPVNTYSGLVYYDDKEASYEAVFEEKAGVESDWAENADGWVEVPIVKEDPNDANKVKKVKHAKAS